MEDWQWIRFGEPGEEYQEFDFADIMVKTDVK